MDYPLLDLLFGIGLLFTLVANTGLRVLLSKMGLPGWVSLVSWLGLVVNLLAAFAIEILLLQRMTQTFNRQMGLWLLVMGGLVAIITANLYQHVSPGPLTYILFGTQMLASGISLVIAFGLYRSLVPIAVNSFVLIQYSSQISIPQLLLKDEAPAIRIKDEDLSGKVLLEGSRERDDTTAI